MKYERDWVRQESSRRRLDGPHELSDCICGRQTCSDRIDTPSCEKKHENFDVVFQFKNPSPDHFSLLVVIKTPSWKLKFTIDGEGMP